MSIIHMFSEKLQKNVHNYSEKVTSSLEVSKPKNHLLVLDGVRAIACLGVLSYHANFLARNYSIWNPLKYNVKGINDLIAALIYFGESGVILFFLLSGFLLFLPFAKVLLFDGKWPHVLRFYLRRIFRIIPGYFVALFLIILFFHPEFFHADHRPQLFHFLTFSMSAELAQHVDGPFWTLAVEFQFYMLLPIIAWIFSLLVRRSTLPRRIIILIGCLFLLLVWGLLSRYWGLSTNGITSTPNPLQHIFLIFKPYVYGDGGKFFEAFAVGMFIAVIYVYAQNAPKREIWLKRFQCWSIWMFLAGLLILGFLSLLHLYYISINPFTYQKYYAVFPTLDPYAKLFSQIWLQWQAMAYAVCYGLCMHALLYGSNRLKRPFEWPVLRWVGLISFSLYMWHLPFIFLYMSVILPQFLGWGGMIKYIGLLAWILFVITPISLNLYRWIEMPGMRLGEMLIQQIEKGKKEPPVDVVSNVPAETGASNSLVEVR